MASGQSSHESKSKICSKEEENLLCMDSSIKSSNNEDSSKESSTPSSLSSSSLSVANNKDLLLIIQPSRNKKQKLSSNHEDSCTSESFESTSHKLLSAAKSSPRRSLDVERHMIKEPTALNSDNNNNNYNNNINTNLSDNQERNFIDNDNQISTQSYLMGLSNQTDSQYPNHTVNDDSTDAEMTNQSNEVEYTYSTIKNATGSFSTRTNGINKSSPDSKKVFKPKTGDDKFSDKSINDILRLICQFVYDQGLYHSYKTIIDETQIHIENALACKLREYILSGDWVSSFGSLDKLLSENLIDNQTFENIKIEIYEQYFFELVLKKKYLDAAMCLQIMIKTADKSKQPSILALSIYLMCSHSDFLKHNGPRIKNIIQYRKILLSSIQKQLGLDIMLPPDRLKNIIQQSFELQANKCRYHQSGSDIFWKDNSILTDHQCTLKSIPTICHQVIMPSDSFNPCKSQILRCKFSPCGEYLVVGGNNGLCLLYKLNLSDYTISLLKNIPGISSSIIDIIWSCDATKFICIGESEKANGIIYDIKKNEVIFDMSTLDFNGLHVCDWFPDSQRFAIGGRHGYIYIFSLQGELLKSINGYRLRSIKTISNFEFYTVDVLNKIIIHDILKSTHNEVIRLREKIIFGTFDASNNILLANIKQTGFKIYDLKNLGSFMIRLLPAMHNRGIFFPSFGGDNNKLIAAGDENSNQILIWKLSEQYPLCELSGHSDIINQVNWNPKFPGILASVSDDSSIRLWISEFYAENLRSNAKIRCKK